MPETTEPVRLSRYVLIYAALIVGASMLVMVIGLLLSSLSERPGSALGIVAKFVAAMVTYQLFIRRHGRLLERGEYWELVMLCGAVTLLWEGILFGLALAGDALPDLSFGAALAMFAIVGALVSFGVPMLGFADFSGRGLLKAELKRRAAIESRN